MAQKAKHAFGSETKVAEALAAGKINAYDILFLDEKKVGWVNKSGEVVIAEGEEYVVHVTELPTTDGKNDVIYIYNNEGYIWNGTQCVPLAKSADLSALENQVTELGTQIATKVDATKVQKMINASIDTDSEVVEF